MRKGVPLPGRLVTPKELKAWQEDMAQGRAWTGMLQRVESDYEKLYFKDGAKGVPLKELRVVDGKDEEVERLVKEYTRLFLALEAGQLELF